MKTRAELEEMVNKHWARKRVGKQPGQWTGPEPLPEALDEIMDAITCIVMAEVNDQLSEYTSDQIKSCLFAALGIVEERVISPNIRLVPEKIF